MEWLGATIGINGFPIPPSQPRMQTSGTSTRVHWRRESRSPAPLVEVLGAASRGPWGQNKNPKIWGLGRL